MTVLVVFVATVVPEHTLALKATTVLVVQSAMQVAAARV
jgi:hypothetical protein